MKLKGKSSRAQYRRVQHRGSSHTQTRAHLLAHLHTKAHTCTHIINIRTNAYIILYTYSGMTICIISECYPFAGSTSRGPSRTMAASASSSTSSSTASLGPTTISSWRGAVCRSARYVVVQVVQSCLVVRHQEGPPSSTHILRLNVFETSKFIRRTRTRRFSHITGADDELELLFSGVSKRTVCRFELWHAVLLCCSI